jgi:hypothetical protein
MVKPPKRQPGQVLCAFVILIFALLYGSDAVLALRRNQPFRMSHEGYLVTDSPWIGLVMSILLAALSVYLVTGSGKAVQKRDSTDTDDPANR